MVFFAVSPLANVIVIAVQNADQTSSSPFKTPIKMVFFAISPLVNTIVIGVQNTDQTSSSRTLIKMVFFTVSALTNIIVVDVQNADQNAFIAVQNTDQMSSSPFKTLFIAVHKLDRCSKTSLSPFKNLFFIVFKLDHCSKTSSSPFKTSSSLFTNDFKTPQKRAFGGCPLSYDIFINHELPNDPRNAHIWVTPLPASRRERENQYPTSALQPIMLRTRQPPTLHVSALSDADYAAYIVAFGAGGSRGVSRGRYGAYVDGVIIDQILKNFAPEQDVLTDGQFFAVMRVVFHAQYGAAVDDSLVFVQAATPTATLSSRRTPPSTSSNSFTRAQSQFQSELCKPPTEPPPASSNPLPHLTSKTPAAFPLNPLLRPRHVTRHQHATPPLPPHKLALLHPLRHGSLARLPVGCLKAANGAQSVKEVLDTLSKERRAEVIRKRGTGSSNDVTAARIAIRSSSSSSISSNERMPAPPAASHPTTAPHLANPCLSPFPYTDTHALPSTITVTISIPVIVSPNAVAAAAAITPSPSSPTTPSGRRPNHRFPFGAIADQDHHHGRSRERGGGEGWYSINELDARLWASSNPGPNLTGPGPSMTDALQCAFAALRPGAGFESVRVRAEGRVLLGYSKMGKGGERLVGEEEMEGGDGDGEGDDDGPDVDSNPDLQAGGTSSLVPGIGSQGQHVNRHQCVVSEMSLKEGGGMRSGGYSPTSEDGRSYYPPGGESADSVVYRGVLMLKLAILAHGRYLPSQGPRNRQLADQLPDGVPYIVFVSHNIFLVELYEALLSWEAEKHHYLWVDYYNTEWSRFIVGMGDHPLENPQGYYQKTFDLDLIVNCLQPVYRRID
ncbi:hypothetical protein BU17DRAFT_99468 [Hysterangium stoloniferum]|nr:hypothetical protein BU17DRAFT_99468 [Hysterangium stoloniferum]